LATTSAAIRAGAIRSGQSSSGRKESRKKYPSRSSRRRLLYGFRDWQNIEATGRAGSDEGFDARAWEKGDAVANLGDEGEEGVHTLEGRLWQIQGKREKTITPAKMHALIREGVSDITPPYGYILAAATNISKLAYDAFREELKEKGVREFYFWGKDYLEDQLSLPQNDEILFTFFGLSLSPRRRTRTAELKFNINNKNKILRMVFGNDHLLGQGVPQGKRFLLRDIKAEHYPNRSQYPDFEKHRRWEEHDVVEVSARGIAFKIRERYAYLDEAKKQWDFSMAVDLTPRKHNIDAANQARLEDDGKKIERFWRHLPRRLQAKLIVYGILPFEDMLIIDDKGDPEYTDPHVFVDFSPRGPFSYTVANLIHHRTVTHYGQLERDFKRISVFPPSIPEPARGNVYDLDTLKLDADAARDVERLRGEGTLLSFDDRLKSLTEGSLIRIPKKDGSSFDNYAEVTHVYEATVGALLAAEGSGFYRSQFQRSAGTEVADQDTVTVHEIHEVIVPYEGNYLSYVDHNIGF
jgi:hypothetical protein